MKWHWGTPVETGEWIMHFYGITIGLVFIGVSTQRKRVGSHEHHPNTF
jgi:hypothetical protein